MSSEPSMSNLWANFFLLLFLRKTLFFHNPFPLVVLFKCRKNFLLAGNQWSMLYQTSIRSIFSYQEEHEYIKPKSGVLALRETTQRFNLPYKLILYSKTQFVVKFCFWSVTSCLIASFVHFLAIQSNNEICTSALGR